MNRLQEVFKRNCEIVELVRPELSKVPHILAEERRKLLIIQNAAQEMVNFMSSVYGMSNNPKPIDYSAEDR